MDAWEPRRAHPGQSLGYREISIRRANVCGFGSIAWYILVPSGVKGPSWTTVLRQISALLGALVVRSRARWHSLTAVAG
jgi:hypothetical protein